MTIGAYTITIALWGYNRYIYYLSRSGNQVYSQRYVYTVNIEYASVHDENLRTLNWLITIRYRVALAFLVVSLISGQIYPEAISTTTAIRIVVVCYLLVNILYFLFLRSNPSQRHVEAIRQAQIPIELLFCTAAIYCSGGVLTPTSIIYMISILVSIILLDPVGVYRTAGMAAVLYCILTALEAGHILPYIKGNWADKDLYEIASPATYTFYTLTVASMLFVLAHIANRVALLIHQRNKQIENQLQDLQVLYDVTNGLGGMTEEKEMLQYLANTLKNLQDSSLCLVGLLSKDGRLELKASVGASPENLRALQSMAINTSDELVNLFTQGKPIIIEDLDKHPDFKTLRAMPSTKSVYVFPITSDNVVLGAFSLSFDKYKSLSSQYNQLLSTIGIQAGVALQRARLLTNAQRMALEMSTLYDFGLQTGSTLSMQEVLNRTSAHIEKLMNPDTYYIARYDHPSQTLIFDLFVESGQPMPKMQMSISDGGLTARIVQTRRPLLVQDWLADGAPYNAVAKRIGADMLSYLGVPMLIEDRVIGVISVQSARPLAFTQHDERFLSALAAQTAMAFENARLHQQMQEQAQLDSLTQLCNHGYFAELAQGAVERAEMDGTEVSLIMIDIDHFKKYNDTYGHIAGNNVLKMVADVLKCSTRPTDATGRWGGEEFVLLLPGTGLADAEKLGKRIQKAIAELCPVDGQGNLIPTPTISQGISTYPYPSTSMSELVEQADDALYYAKENGRDQLTICEAFGMMRSVLKTSPLSAKL